MKHCGQIISVAGLGLAILLGLLMLGAVCPARAALPELVPTSPDALASCSMTSEELAAFRERFPCGLQRTTREEAEALGFTRLTSSDLRGLREQSGRSVPGTADLLDYMPPVGAQQFNDCAAFSLGHYGVSYWHFREGNRTPTANPADIGSSEYIYNQSNAFKDQGLLSLIDPIFITITNGCAFESVFDPGNTAALPSIETQLTGLPQRAGTRDYIYVDRNVQGSSLAPGVNPVTDTELQTVKELLAEGIPVIAGINVYTSFNQLTNVAEGFYYRGPLDWVNEYAGGHAIMIAGYKDAPEVEGGGAFYLRNSWDTDWGFGGDIFVTYDFLQNHSLEAYPLYDLPDYTPEQYAVITVDHPYRGDLDVRIEANNEMVGLYSPYIMSSMHGGEINADNRPDIRAVIDLTKVVPDNADQLVLAVSDHLAGHSGTITRAEYVDTTTGATKAFNLPDGSAVPDLGTVTGTLQFAAPTPEPTEAPEPEPTTAPEPTEAPAPEPTTEPDPTDAPAPAGSGGGGGCSLGYAPAVLALLLPLMLLARRR